jgi:hypothetical protein
MNQFQTLPQRATGPINFYQKGKGNEVESSIQFVDQQHSQRVGGEDAGSKPMQSRTILSGSTQTGITNKK